MKNSCSKAGKPFPLMLLFLDPNILFPCNTEKGRLFVTILRTTLTGRHLELSSPENVFNNFSYLMWMWFCMFLHAFIIMSYHQVNKVNFKETKPQISSNNDWILSNLNILPGSGCHNHDYTLGDVHSKNLFSHSSWGWSLRSRCGQGWFLLRPLSSTCRWSSSDFFTCFPPSGGSVS